MNNIERIFRQYKNNMDKMNTYRDQFFEFQRTEDWREKYQKNMSDIEAIYRENANLVKEITHILDTPMTEYLANSLYEQAMSMYQMEYDDSQLLANIFETLEKFYERDSEKNINRLMSLYIAHSYEINAVQRRQASIRVADFSILEKGLSYRDRYASLNEDARVWFWKAAFNYAVVGMDRKNWPLKESFEKYYEYLDFWYSEEVQNLDGENEDINTIIAGYEANVLYFAMRCDELDEETIPYFIMITDRAYKLQRKEVSDDMDLYVLTYAAYMYSLYLRGEETIDGVFDKFYQYFIYKDQIHRHNVMDYEVVYFYYVCVKFLTVISKKGINAEKQKQLLGVFWAIADMKWKLDDSGDLLRVLQLSTELCSSIVMLSDKDTDIENIYYRLNVRKNFISYIHAKNVSDLAVMIFEECHEKCDLFREYHGMDYDTLHEYVKKCGIFHDLGSIATTFLHYYKYRPLFPQESALIHNHPLAGVEIIEKSKEMEKYKEILMGHHKNYDGKGGAPLDYDNTTAKNKLVVDLIHIADFIDLKSDKFFMYDILPFDEVLRELEEGSGTKYHPEIVRVILESESLKEKIAKRIEMNLDSVQEYYENAEEVMRHQSTEEFVQQLEEKMEEAFANHTEDEFMNMVERLFTMTAKDYSDRILGIAYYYTMRVHLFKKAYMEAFNAANEAVTLLENTDEYEKYCISYNVMGAVMQIMGNPNSALQYYMLCVEKGKLCEDKPELLLYPYNNIADLMKNLNQVERAIYYYNMAENLQVSNEKEKMPIWCNMLYCYIFIGDEEKIAIYEKKIHENIKDNDFPKFMVYIYLAWLEEYRKHYDVMNQYIQSALEDEDYMSMYSSYLDEIHICLALLEKTEQYELLYNLTDAYLTFIDQDEISYKEYQRFLQRRARCAKKQKNIELLMDTLELLDESIQSEGKKVSEKMIEMEKDFVDTINRQEKQKKLQKEKERLEVQVKEEKNANQAKSSFLSSMSHEIRTPIHAILGLDEMILRECDEPEILDYAKDIEDAGKTLLGIINDVLDFSKMEAGKLQLLPQAFDLSELLLDINEQIRPKAMEKQLQFVITCDKDVPRYLTADDYRIRQILLNILSNGVKYTNEGRIDFIISAEKKSSENLNLKFQVKDTGMGMREEDIERLFKPFERIYDQRNMTVSGTGLGMSIVISLVKQMNGLLDVNSEYKKGTDFVVYIPVKVDKEQPIGKFEEYLTDKDRTGESKAFSTTLKDTDKKRALFTAPDAKVLVVDDNAVNIKVISNLLKRTRVKLTTATSGEECLLLVKKETFDLILLDHQMPGMDGVETLHRMRAENALEQTPVIALTANAFPKAEEHYASLGFDDLLTKPVKVEEMETKIMKYLPKELVIL